MKKLITLLALFQFCATVQAQNYRNHSSIWHVEDVIDSAMKGKVAKGEILMGVIVVSIDKEGYVTSCKQWGPSKELVKIIPEINKSLPALKLKVDPFIKDGVYYPSYSIVPVNIFPSD